MTVNSQNVFTGAPDQLTTGAILRAPLGTALPTAIGTALNVAFKDSGYIGNDGLKLTPSTSTETIKDWSGATIREVLTEFSAKMAWTHLELSTEALKVYFGDDNVTTTAATVSTGTLQAIKLNAVELPTCAWAFKIKDGVRKVLITVPQGQVTERGEITFTKASAVSLPVVMSTYPDATGNNVYIYTDDGVFSA
jgi:hypothetical protein